MGVTTDELERLKAELAKERQARSQAEESLQRLSHERQRLQRARDELAKNVLVCKSFLQVILLSPSDAEASVRVTHQSGTTQCWRDADRIKPRFNK